jgi:hypothetical protein
LLVRTKTGEFCRVPKNPPLEFPRWTVDLRASAWPLYGALQDSDLVAPDKNLQLKSRTAPKRGGKCGDERGE